MEKQIKTQINLTQLIKRLRILLIVGICTMGFFHCLDSYFKKLAAEKQALLYKLTAITSTLSTSINGDIHQHLFNKYPHKDGIKSNDQNSNYAALQKKLFNAFQINQLRSSIYTLVLDSSADSGKPIFKFGIASSENPFFRHSYVSYPKELLETYYSGGTLLDYEDENGTWISSWTPIKNKNGKVVGVVQADYPFNDFIINANKILLKEFAISLIFLALICLFLNNVFSSLIKRENAIGSLNDLIESQKSMITETKIAKEKAEEAVKAKSRFLANMSHEIRTPLNGVMGLTNLLLNTNPNSKQKQYLDSVVTSSETLMVVINDILDISKIEAGKLTIQNKSFNLKNTFSQIIEMMNSKAVESGLELELVIDPLLPEILIGDPARLSQILYNIVGNSIKFTEKGKVIIVASLKEKEASRIWVEFKISDTGYWHSRRKIIFHIWCF